MIASPSALAVTSLQLSCDPGAFVCEGPRLYTLPPDTFFAEIISGAVQISVRPAAGGFWDLDFAAPNNQPLTVGTYLGATRWPFQGPDTPGLNVDGNGSGCVEVSGSFEVKQIVYDGRGGISAFWATFEQHCENQKPAFRGEIKFNAEIAAVPALSPTHLAILALVLAVCGVFLISKPHAPA